MRILHIAMGSPEIDRAAVELGHTVRRIPWRERLGRKFINGAPSFLQREILQTCKDFKPDLVFCQTHQSDIIAGSTYDAMRRGGAFVVNWCGDVREPLPDCYRRYADQVDVMAFSNMTDVEEIRSMGLRSEYLQIGYDPEIYHPGEGKQERNGIVFMANHYAGRFPNTELRKEVALRLMEEFPDDFTLYGRGWDIPGVRPTLTGEEEAEIYRHALIAINVDHFTRPYFASDRILRAQACGACVFAAHYPGGELEHPHVHFTDAESLVQKVKEWMPFDLRSHGEWQAKHTQRNHRWHNRIQTMQGWMS